MRTLATSAVTGFLHDALSSTHPQMRAQRDDLPLVLSLRHLLEGEEYHHRTAFVVVDDDFDLDGLIEATERAAGGDFDVPNSGLLFVVPVTRALGMRPYWKREIK